jgi:hypothetical protein
MKALPYTLILIVVLVVGFYLGRIILAKIREWRTDRAMEKRNKLIKLTPWVEYMRVNDRGEFEIGVEKVANRGTPEETIFGDISISHPLPPDYPIDARMRLLAQARDRAFEYNATGGTS